MAEYNPLDVSRLRNNSEKSRKVSTTTDINRPISYMWKFGWDGMVGNPVVNPLMKAIIESNYPEIKRLIVNGASPKLLEKNTLQRVLFIKIKDYRIISLFTALGARYYYPDVISEALKECLDEHGHILHTVTCAYSSGAYDVFELLLSAGYFDLDLIDMIFSMDDLNSMKLLMNYGFEKRIVTDSTYFYNGINHHRYYLKHYENTKCYQYLTNTIVFRRKSYAISPNLIYSIPKPVLEKPGFFNRKKVEAYNQAIMDDYYDQVRVQKELIDSLTPKQRELIRQTHNERYKQREEAYDAMVKLANLK